MDIQHLSRVGLKAKRIELKGDIEFITNVVAKANGQEIAGMESVNVDDVIVKLSESINKNYGTQITPDVAGLEGFMDSLKDGFKAVAALLKGSPSKKEQAVVKKYFWEAKKAADVYNSAKWQNEQVFKNIGNCKFEMPPELDAIESIADVKKILDTVTSKHNAEFKKYHDNVKARLAVGMKIFSKYENKKFTDENVAALVKEYPIKPAGIEIPNSYSLGDLGGSNSPGSVPVLKKDEIKEVTKLMVEISDLLSEQEEEREDTVFDALSNEDFWDSEFFDQVPDKDLSELKDAVEWHHLDDNGYRALSDAAEKFLLRFAQFLENWILYSVK